MEGGGVYLPFLSPTSFLASLYPPFAEIVHPQSGGWGATEVKSCKSGTDPPGYRESAKRRWKFYMHGSERFSFQLNPLVN